MSDYQKDIMNDKLTRRKLLAAMGMAGAGAALSAIGMTGHASAAPASSATPATPGSPGTPAAPATPASPAGSSDSGALAGMAGCGEYNVMDYGAVGDGSTDDTAAVQGAVNAAAAAGGGTVCFPFTANGYLLGDITITKPVKLAAGGREVKLTAKAATGKLFTIRSSFVEINGFFINMGNAGSSSIAIYLDTAAQTMEHIYLRDLIVWNAYAVLRDGKSSNIIVNLHVSNVTCRINKGVAVHLTDAFAYTFFKNVNVDNVPSAQIGIPINFAGVIVENAQGFHFENCDVTGGNGNAGGDGFVIKNSEAVYFDTCMADTVGGVGFLFENVWYLYLVAVVSSLCHRGGMTLNGCRFVNGTNIVMAGRTYLPDKVANADGIKAVDSQRITMAGLSCRYNTGNGITVDSSSYTMWSTNDLFENTLKGLQEKGQNLTANTFIGCTFNANGSNYQIVSPFTHVCNALLHSGVFQANQAGPASF